jgi:tetratricopeptide (TPR) repeat protein
MAINLNRVALVLASATLLSGCQFLGSLNLGHRGGDVRTSKAMASFYTDKGRELLRSGRPGEAIEAFNLALATGEVPAPAYNGLGVAYSRIGRPDLSYRFFKKATMSAPDNPVFANNLDRLVKSPQFTLDMSPDFQAPQAPQQAASAPTGQAANAAPPVAGRLHKSGSHQFSIVTLDPAASEAPAATTRRAQRQGCGAVRSTARDCSGAASVQVVTRRKLPVAAPAAAAQGTDVAGNAAAPKAAPAPQRKTIDMRTMPSGAAPVDDSGKPASTRT